MQIRLCKLEHPEYEAQENTYFMFVYSFRFTSLANLSCCTSDLISEVSRDPVDNGIVEWLGP